MSVFMRVVALGAAVFAVICFARGWSLGGWLFVGDTVGSGVASYLWSRIGAES